MQISEGGYFTGTYNELIHNSNARRSTLNLTFTRNGDIVEAPHDFGWWMTLCTTRKNQATSVLKVNLVTLCDHTRCNYRSTHISTLSFVTFLIL